MCANHNENKNKRLLLVSMYLIAILFGVFSGLSGISFFESFGLMISDVFIKIFKCISLPIIALSLIVTLSSQGNNGGIHKMWQRTVYYTLSTTVIAASVACGLYIFIKPEKISSFIGESGVLQVR